MEEGGSGSMILDVEYNGIVGSSLDIYAKELPAIPTAKKREKEITIPGRSGTIYTTDGEYESTEIKIPFNYIGKEELWDERWSQAKKWLSARYSRLYMSTDQEYFYKISKVTLDDAEHTTARIGNFTATFTTLDGLRYLEAGRREYPINKVRYNPFEEAYPIFKIYGEGQCDLSVNGKHMKANVGQNLTIDTERKLAYREDGKLFNTAVTGDYEDLKLIEGENEILITNGFELKIIPNWRRL